MDPLNVITLADEAYAMPLAVMVRSLLDYLAPGRAIRVLVMDGGITPELKQRLNDSWRGSPGWQHCRVEYVAPSYGVSTSVHPCREHGGAGGKKQRVQPQSRGEGQSKPGPVKYCN